MIKIIWYCDLYNFKGIVKLVTYESSSNLEILFYFESLFELFGILNQR